MMMLAWLILTGAAAISAGLFAMAGMPVDWSGLAGVYIAMVLATEGALLAIRTLKGDDQAAATQAGMSGMVLLMMLSLALLGAMRFSGVVKDGAIIRLAPLLFVAALVLVSWTAIRTIKSAPAAKLEQKPNQVRNRE